mmetsp:Transcript_76694/g.225144  ORF Transcript_76694/g.225144 Transcript_76694/m.225144 type:complete len:297 (-) Transcript_76694:229-1119(-)
MQARALHRRRVRRVGALVQVHGHLRRRHLGPHATHRPHGERVRRGTGGQELRSAVLQRASGLRGSRRLRADRVGELVRLLRQLRRRHAALQARRHVRQGRGQVVRGRAEGDLALQPRAARGGARRLRLGRGHQLPLRRLGGVERVHDLLWRGPARTKQSRGAAPCVWGEAVPGRALRAPGVRPRGVRRAPVCGLRVRRLERLGRLHQVQRPDAPDSADQEVPGEWWAAVRGHPDGGDCRVPQEMPREALLHVGRVGVLGEVHRDVRHGRQAPPPPVPAPQRQRGRQAASTRGGHDR